MKRNISLALLCALLFSCSGGKKKSETKPEPKPKPKADVREVSTAAELINAIGPNRTLKLKSGTYVLSEVPDSFKEHVVWSKVFDGKTIAIKGVNGLTISGPKDRSAKLLVRPRYAYVLEFKNCERLRLENLVMGHAPKKGYCQYGVLGLKNVRDVKINNCDLFGCGTEGLTLLGVSDFAFSGGVVRDCSYGIMTLKDCKRASFSDSTFTENREYWGVQVDHCDGVSFKSCHFTKNKIGGALFSVTSSSPVLLEKAKLEGNTVKRLVDNPKMLKVTAAEN